MKLKTGDRVMVIAGKDAGTESRIEKVYPGEDKVLVEGVNVAAWRPSMA
jgi:large subunit ribosomal protein L24